MRFMWEVYDRNTNKTNYEWLTFAQVEQMRKQGYIIFMAAMEGGC